MFGQIAHRYDVMNRLMTMGQDVRWRKLLVQAVNLPKKRGRLLDVAIGTGDVACETLRQHPHLEIIAGIDFAMPMIQIGQKRNCSDKIDWHAGNALQLPFHDHTFDAVVSGFLLRNVIDVRQTLMEQVRVCRRGGQVAILEIPRPAYNWHGKLFRLYFHNIVPIIGGIISGQLDAYRYLPNSADAFLSADELKQTMEAVGLKNVRFAMLMFHTVALHVGEK